MRDQLKRCVCPIRLWPFARDATGLKPDEEEHVRRCPICQKRMRDIAAALERLRARCNPRSQLEMALRQVEELASASNFLFAPLEGEEPGSEFLPDNFVTFVTSAGLTYGEMSPPGESEMLPL
jgi:hypothetical protein